VSDKSVESEYCQLELRHALKEQKIVLPILLQTYSQDYPRGMPPDLADLMQKVQYIDLTAGYDDLSKLWGAINRIQDRSLKRVDRWVLYNQFEVLKLLNLLVDKHGNADEYSMHQDVISRGYEWNYDEISDHIHTPIKYGQCEEVHSIFEMYRNIGDACTSLDCSNIDSTFIRFGGFDGNNEIKHYSYAQFLIEKRSGYGDLRPEPPYSMNSHSPRLDKYLRMVREWKRSEKPYELSYDDIIRIVDA